MAADRPDFVIGTATEADIPVLNQLVNSAYRGDTSRRGWTTEADLLDGPRTSAADLRTMLANPLAQILTYRTHGQLVGCVYLEYKKPELYLGMLTVSPDAQAGGIGKLLLSAAEEIGNSTDCQSITITVLAQRHELIAWYKRRGYQLTGALKPFPDDPRFGLPRQPLTFVVMRKLLT